jgi:hypothetical protein
MDQYPDFLKNLFSKREESVNDFRFVIGIIAALFVFMVWIVFFSVSVNPSSERYTPPIQQWSIRHADGRVF